MRRTATAPSQNQPPAATVKKTDWLAAFLTALTALAFVAALVALFPAAHLAGQSGWLAALLLVLLTAATLTALAQQLPWQNVLLVAGGIALLGGGASAIGAKTNLPFGPFVFGENAGAKIFDTLPWTLPLLWIVVVLNARGVARLTLRPWRKAKTYGFRLVAATAMLVLLFDVALDPFATHTQHYWFWTTTKLPLTWQTAPLVNFFVWGALAALMLAFTTPALIRKQPGQKSGPDYQPLAVWLGALLLFGTGAYLSQLWPVLAVDAAIGIVTSVLAIRGARW